MMVTRICLSICLWTLILFALPCGADERQANEDSSEIRVRLRLNLIEASKLMEHYESLVTRELTLQGCVQACMLSGEERLPQYQKALKETQAGLDAATKKLVTLESEKTKLIARLGIKNLRETSPEPGEGSQQTLEKILECLNRIEKRLEKMERR